MCAYIFLVRITDRRRSLGRPKMYMDGGIWILTLREKCMQAHTHIHSMDL